jgi:hypothetical protein
MCRIASIFLLQKLKGSTSGDMRDFNNIETQAVIKLLSASDLPNIQCIYCATIYREYNSLVPAA